MKKPDNPIVVARRNLLKAEVKSQGAAVVARAAGKPQSQIADMVEGRKAFGDKVAREIGPKIRGDLPSDWLLSPTISNQLTAHDLTTTPYLKSAAVKRLPKRKPPQLEKIIALANTMSEDGLNALIGAAIVIANQYPRTIESTAK